MGNFFSTIRVVDILVKPECDKRFCYTLIKLPNNTNKRPHQ